MKIEMLMFKYKFYPELTIERIKRLNEYCSKNIHTKDTFACSKYNECRTSHSGNFYEGQLSHVGKLYDASLNEKPFRILIVGQEYGTNDRLVSLEQRAEMIYKSGSLTFSKRNPHMRGTTSVLRLLFNKGLGKDADGELQQFNNEGYHIFDTFALVNFLLCSAIKAGGGKKGKATDEMKRNCSKHFRATLEILEPTIIILQSRSFLTPFLGVFDHTELLTKNLYIGMIKNKKIFLGCFTHPSTPTNKDNWGRDEKTQYLLKTIAPTINIITENYSRIF